MAVETVKPDIVAERAVLGGLFQYGSEAYFDIVDVVQPETFTDDTNQAIYKCIKSIYEQDHDAKLDYALVISRANDIGYGSLFKKTEVAQHLRTIANTRGELRNVRKHAAKLRKLDIALSLTRKIEEAKSKLATVTGNESMEEILSMVEGPIFEHTSSLNTDGDKSMNRLADGIDEYIQNIMDNPVESVGLSTGYTIYDESIGGGLRPPELDIIGARMKVGKTQLADNIAFYVAETYNIPVMNLDTEMSREQHWNRIIANLSDVPVNEIQTGKFTKHTKDEYGTPAEKIKRVLAAKERFKKVPYYYDCIANRPFEETLAALRRWLMKEVGFEGDGKAKPCLVVYDYIKLLSAEGLGSSMQEFQMLGFLVTALKNFQIRYNIPVLAFCQLNRDAIDKETTDIVMGSDRILMYCSSFSIYKTKSREEIAEDGNKNGNRKLIPKISRNGPAMDDGNYINMQFDGDYARIKQLNTKDDIELAKEHAKEFEIEGKDGDDDYTIPFAPEDSAG